MKIEVRLKHSKKSKMANVIPSTFFFDKESSTGPVIGKGKSVPILVADLKKGDVIEFRTTEFSDEFDVLHVRDGKIVNSVGGELKA